MNQTKLHDPTRLQQMFHETSTNPTTAQGDTTPLIQADDDDEEDNVPTPRATPRRTATTAPQEITPSPRISNAPTFEEEHDNSLARNTQSRKPTILQEYIL